ncbi:DMT family transporter [Pseudooceanicola aestuarii]|uniref:DMT family transporter n=1 Tax=Pseudooceanicola aestuarii TaxID=2697319 RepID=UPI0013D17167|nr:DMT family transporter [Pseudooceanicola aestuarii]
MTPAESPTRNPGALKAAGLVIMAMFLIVISDAAGKELTATGFEPLFVAWVRFALGALLVLPLSGLIWSELALLRDWRLWLRAALIVGGIGFILTALRTEPIANVFGGFFISPVAAFVLSALLLGERVTVARAVLLAVGFAGVLLVVKPGFGMRPGMGFAVLAGCCHGGYLVATRWVAGEMRPRFLVLSQLMIGALILAAPGLATLPAAVDTRDMALLSFSAAGSALGNVLLVLAARVLPAGLIAPLIYSQLVSAMIVGFAAFGEFPDGLALAGIAIILATGAGSLWYGARGR